MNDEKSKQEQEYRIFVDNLKNTTMCIDSLSSDNFINGISNQLNNDKNNIYSVDLIKKLYNDIIGVNKYINIRIDMLYNICENSRSFGYVIYDDKTNRVQYLLYMYTYFIRFIIEYNFERMDNGIASELMLSINNYQYYDIIYENINNDYHFSLYDSYLYAKNEFLNNIIKDKLQLLRGNDIVLSTINKSIKDLSDKNNEIINKFNEIEVSGEDYILKFQSEMNEIEKTLRDDIYEKVSIIQSLEASVNNINNGLTFIGLEKAYEKFSIQKGREKRNARNVLKISVSLLFLPIIVKIISYACGTVYNYYGYALTATATLLFLYLFRVSLLNYQSIKAELTQINLRRSLCMFIQGYTEFSVKHEDRSSLSKFESLVFSNVIPDSKKIPSTLDGLEQLAKLFESMKGKNS
ncbi:hypothetical protein ABJA15_001428 [Morganella morganii]|nr:hypothetical protein [Morganella morganii]